MIRLKKNGLALALTAFALIFFGVHAQVVAQDVMKKQAKIAFKKLHHRQKDDGAWKSVFSFDTVPEGFRTEYCSWHNLVMIDLLQPLAADYPFDSLLIKPMIYVWDMFGDSTTGLVKFGTRIKEYPKDSDDTALFWVLNEVSDSTVISGIIDTLQVYRHENGLYYIWLREQGCFKLRSCGKDPNPTDLLSNIHVYLFLKRYAPGLADELCEAFQQNIEELKYSWTYNSRTPWLYYIRQIELERDSCNIPWEDLDSQAKPFTGQETYIEMSKLIRDLALGRESEITLERTREVLQEVAEDNFNFVKTHPIAMFHNDLTTKRPAYFWSHDLPYALWLRLYYEYSEPQAKKK